MTRRPLPIHVSMSPHSADDRLLGPLRASARPGALRRFGHRLLPRPRAQVHVVSWRAGAGPQRVVVRADRPVRLVFERPGNERASDWVAFSEHGLLTTLSPFGRTTVDLPQRPPGVYEFHGEGRVLRGVLVVE